ncbi:MAG: hypothetical protein IKT41_01435 [Clostridia bacterium]|nr:hypothetical protein [Clostridia bacterium]
MINLKNNKGITITALIITVVVLTIIAGTATYTGIEVYEDSKKEIFVQELQMVQNTVNTENSKIKSGDYSCLALGTDIDGNYTDADGKVMTAIESTLSEGETIDWTLEKYQYAYFTKEELKTLLGITNVNQDVIINFLTCDVISVNGIEIDGDTYYNLEQMGIATNYYDKTQTDNNLYIQDNLISWWDAIDNGNTKVWKDLSGNNDLTFKGTTPSREEKYIELDSTSTDSYLHTNNSILPEDGDFTIEIRANLSLRDERRNMIFTHGNQNNYRFYLSVTCNSSGFYTAGLKMTADDGTIVAPSMGSYIKFDSKENVKSYFNNKDITHCVVREGQKITVKLVGDQNAKTYTLPTGVSIISNDGFMIGAGGMTGYPPEKMKVYSCRIYNKALTDEELLYNYKIDNKRFD